MGEKCSIVRSDYSPGHDHCRFSFSFSFLLHQLSHIHINMLVVKTLTNSSLHPSLVSTSPSVVARRHCRSRSLCPVCVLLHTTRPCEPFITQRSSGPRNNCRYHRHQCNNLSSLVVPSSMADIEQIFCPSTCNAKRSVSPVLCVFSPELGTFGWKHGGVVPARACRYVFTLIYINISNSLPSLYPSFSVYKQKQK